MNTVVDGFKNQIWLIIGMDGYDEISEERHAFNDVTEADIVRKIETLAASHLTPREIIESPNLYKARIDSGSGKRTIYTAGADPHYVASLWRADELASRDQR